MSPLLTDDEIARRLRALDVPDRLIEAHLVYQRSRGRVAGYVRRADTPPSPPTVLTTTRQGAPRSIVPRARPGEPEHDEQVALFDWAATADAQHPELRWLFAVPNFTGRLGKATARHGAFLKAEGRKPGVPDVILPVRRGGHVGVVIEMKIKPNRPSDVQRQWLLHFESESWCVNVCYSFEEARDALLRYLIAPEKSA